MGFSLGNSITEQQKKGTKMLILILLVCVILGALLSRSVIKTFRQLAII